MKWFRMTIRWREREHSAIENEVMQDQQSLDILRYCRLLNNFKMKNMKTNTRLLEILVNYWGPDEDYLMIDQIPLRIELENIYFIIGLSRRGEPVDLHGKPTGGFNLDDYV